MITTLLENGNFFQSYGLLIIMIALIAIILVFSATRRKKEAKMADEFVNNLKVGDKVKTYSGIYGTVLSLKETPNGKIAVIETGERGSKTTMIIKHKRTIVPLCCILFIVKYSTKKRLIFIALQIRMDNQYQTAKLCF